MDPRKRTARLAGIYYLFNVLLSIYYMEYVPGEIMVWGNPEKTMNNFLNNETLFRIAILVGIAVHISFILLPITLYKLLMHVNKHYALLMVVFALISVPISFGLLLHQYELVGLFNDYTALGIEQRQAIDEEVLGTFEKLYNGFFLCQTFWGLWLLPFGFLVFKSGFLPKFLGVALMLGCVTYLLDIIGGTLFRDYYEYINTRILIIPAAIGEIGMCIWLLTIGVKDNAVMRN